MNRNSIKCFLLLCLLAGAGSFSFAQNLSNRGTEFLVGYGHHYYMEPASGSTGPPNTQEMVLYFSAEQAANVTVTINNAAYVRNYVVPANSVIASELIPKGGPFDARLITAPCSFLPPGFPCGGEGVFTNKSIRIVSDVPIVAYAHIYGSASSGATMLMPIETWGYSYISLNNDQRYVGTNGSSFQGTFSWAYVIADHDNTVIEVTPSNQTRTQRPANVPYTVTLNKGDVYQFMAGPEGGGAKPNLSGSKVRSIANASGQCYPVAMFSGSSRTYGIETCGTAGGGDNENQQCFPEQAWGKRYLLAPLSSSSNATNFMNNSYRILVKDPMTQVYRNGTLMSGLTSQGYYQFNSNQPEYITSDKPVMIAQFIGSNVSGCLNGGVGDPEMIYLSPVEQGIKKIGFYRNRQQSISVNYLTLIIPTNGIPSLRIDNSTSFDHVYPHSRLPGYSIVIKRWTSSNSQATAVSDSAFTAVTYGLGGVESYGYNAGTLINNLNGVADIHNTLDPATPSHDFTCTETPVELSMLIAYQPTKMVWKMSELGSVITPNADVVDNAPVSNGTRVVDGITYYRYSLPGTYMFHSQGTFRIPVDCTHPSVDNCTNTEELSFIVEVREPPTAEFSLTHSGCRLDPVAFSSPDSSANGFDVVTYNWSSPGGISATGQNPSITFPTAGTKAVTLEVISKEGCVGDTTINIDIFNPPVNSINANPVTVCGGGSITFTGSTNFTGSGTPTGWYWDFGDGSAPITPGNGNPQTKTFPNYGSYTVKYSTSISATCPGDTATQVVNVRALPDVNFSYPAGCLPADGNVQFSSSATTADGRSVASVLWDFGDPNATAANPNTSTAASPTHYYSTFGNYTIRFSATTVDGCTKDTVVNATFNMRPVLAYPALPALCQNDAAVSVATASVTNSVPGSGVYSGPGTTSAGMFNPALAGPGTHTIKYIFSSTAGCVDSISRTILVRAKPMVNFSIPTGACLPTTGAVTFDNLTTIADGQTMAWQWNFDDPNANAGNPNTSTVFEPSHNFGEGSFDVRLTATTPNGCVGDTVITQNLAVRPALAYPAIAAQCANITTPVSIATATVTNGVAGTGVYSGPGTTAAGMFNPSAAGEGTHTIKYVFTTAGGCADSISRTVTVHPKPRVNFDVTTTGCLPTTGLVTFTNSSNVPAGQTLTYAWNFDDPNATASNPNTSTAPTPQHNFREGAYDILLTATTNNGCVHDTTITKTFSVKPELDFTSPGSVCENETTPVSIATATVLNNVTGTGVYSGPGTTAAGMFTPSLAGAGTHTIKYVYTTTGGCKDSLTRTILVREKPNVLFSTAAGSCLPTTGLVAFSNGSSVTDGQTISYVWNFDDPNASSSNPNTSTATSPQHNYREGTYDVMLTATTDNGCVNDTTITYTFGVKPALTFTAFPNYCEDQIVPVSGDLAQTTNNVTGVGVYSGPGITADGQFTPSVAGNGTHTIKYVFTTTGGCKDSITRTVTVNPKPRVAFTVTSDVCADQVATIDDNSTIPSGSIATWQWYFGNGRDTVRTTGANFTEAYPNFGSYDVKLVAISNNGCVSDTARQTVNSHSLPEVNFELPEFVCMPAGNAAFINHSVSPDGSALAYQWNFGDGSGMSTDVSPTHVYTAATPVNITLSATSPFGCSSSLQQTLDDFFDQPIASFGVSPLNLCQGTPSILTDSSTAPNSAIRFWNWQFGDGDHSELPAPNKTYLLPGNYTISLTVKNEFGCESDPATRNVTVYLQPVIDAGPNIIVPLNSLITLKPSANDSTNVNFLWTPPGEIPDPTVLRPTFVATRDYEYTLTATGAGGCTATDVMFVKVLNPVNVPNAFSPNGDGINDTWRIDYLLDYPGATVDVFNRYGQVVYSSVGYDKAWDGRFKGKELPLATYYYVINLKNGFAPLKGSVTIVK